MKLVKTVSQNYLKYIKTLKRNNFVFRIISSSADKLKLCPT